jgi:hypothetical protein
VKIALAAAHVQIHVLPDQFPKELIIMKLMQMLASIVAHVQIHALHQQFPHNKVRKIHATRVFPVIAGAYIKESETLTFDTLASLSFYNTISLALW